MRDEPHHTTIEAVIRQAESDKNAQTFGGFVIVKWMERYTYYPTPIPQATLETIVDSYTRAEVVARYARVDGVWVPLSPEGSSAHTKDGSSEEGKDNSE